MLGAPLPRRAARLRCACTGGSLDWVGFGQPSGEVRSEADVEPLGIRPTKTSPARLRGNRVSVRSAHRHPAGRPPPSGPITWGQARTKVRRRGGHFESSG